jgi:predicted CoA-substrate-specific enzyme activase
VDIGSVAIGSVLINGDGEILGSDYRFHHGNIEEETRAGIQAAGADGSEVMVRTTQSPDILHGAHLVDDRVAAITAARTRNRKLGSLLIVGGERFSMIHFDEQGAYRRLITNSSCAAGTGSFLDQQARRLSLSGSAELSNLALRNQGEPPKIASRCAVFAKTDLIHSQAEGYTLEEICDGLCLGLAKNIADTLVTDEAPPEPIVFAGGVARNEAVVHHLKHLLGAPIHPEEYSHLYGAYGAALVYRERLQQAAGGHPAASEAENETSGTEHRAAESSAAGAQSQGTAPDNGLRSLVAGEKSEKHYFFDPLSLQMTDYPDFAGEESYVYRARSGEKPVEVELYNMPEPGSELRAHLGIDIGSTSTKAVLYGAADENSEDSADGAEGTVYAGFYTRTAGKPLEAVKAIFETAESAADDHRIMLTITDAATTGSGRKFVGKVIGADTVVDEITAHARAAYELNPEIDTIIEIGGQDSKFTTMRDGMVTFCQMNTICAAGTGSFIEEQADKLGVPLSEYSARAEGRPAPLTSDRCTVFMERDINHYLNKNYSVDEVLAAALFSVRENYLQKVATEAHIGERVCFQGATGKNRALVAAFEQKLGRPLFVSRYCHLTGAIGAALITAEERSGPSSFRGIELHREEIPVRTETCELCTNHCRLRIAEVRGEQEAFGFLCGRDYDTKRYVDRNRSGFDLVKARRQAFVLPEESKAKREQIPAGRRLLGLPAGLHMAEELPLWQTFFAELGVPVITSEKCVNPIKEGKELTGAEFCAPMTAYHGHVAYLAERTDLLFLPIYIEGRKRKDEAGKDRKLCYYSQYSSAIVSAVARRQYGVEALKPLIRQHNFTGNVQEIHRALHEVYPHLSIFDVAGAWSKAVQFQEQARESVQEIYRRETGEDNPEDVQAVITGRPYTVLSPQMNNRIPEIFGTLGVKAFFQDMLPADRESEEEIAPLLEAFHWNYAAQILRAAAYAARTPGLYPVYVTSFKCSPDSFAVDYFKRILDAAGKPYLILQLDEHDSSVGYETRIEAGVRAFRNHFRKEMSDHRLSEDTVTSETAEPGSTSTPGKPGSESAEGKSTDGGQGFQQFTAPLRQSLSRLGRQVQQVQQGLRRKANPMVETDITDKTILFPNWDPLTNPLVAANLRSGGYDVRILEESPEQIQKSMSMNSGQCLPINIIAQEAMDYVRRYGLDPEKTVLWMAQAYLACNLPMYPYYIKSLFEEAGGGMEKLGVYVGEITHAELSPRLSISAYFAYMFGGLLRRLGCRIRPYEINPGETNRLIRSSHAQLIEAFEGKRALDETIAPIIGAFEAIPRRGEQRPKVAVFGDLYVRDNETMNQDLIRTIEEAGGEVITTPYNEYTKIIAGAYFRRWFKQGHYLTWLKNRSLLKAMELVERRYYSYFKQYLDSSIHTAGDRQLDEMLATFDLRVENEGESLENVLKIFHLLEEHDDIALFVQASPSFCCPALVTEAMNRDIERVTGIPVVSITYDGTGSIQNDRIVPYLAFGAGSRRPGKKQSTTLY